VVDPNLGKEEKEVQQELDTKFDKAEKKQQASGQTMSSPFSDPHIHHL
jgi:hypothetical protein